MAVHKPSEKICKSVFRSGKDTTTKENWTKQWIQLMHTLEQAGQRPLHGKDTP